MKGGRAECLQQLGWLRFICNFETGSYSAALAVLELRELPAPAFRVPGLKGGPCVR